MERDWGNILNTLFNREVTKREFLKGALLFGKAALGGAVLSALTGCDKQPLPQTVHKLRKDAIYPPSTPPTTPAGAPGWDTPEGRARQLDIWILREEFVEEINSLLREPERDVEQMLRMVSASRGDRNVVNEATLAIEEVLQARIAAVRATMYQLPTWSKESEEKWRFAALRVCQEIANDSAQTESAFRRWFQRTFGFPLGDIGPKGRVLCSRSTDKWGFRYLGPRGKDEERRAVLSGAAVNFWHQVSVREGEEFEMEAQNGERLHVRVVDFDESYFVFELPVERALDQLVNPDILEKIRYKRGPKFPKGVIPQTGTARVLKPGDSIEDIEGRIVYINADSEDISFHVVKEGEAEIWRWVIPNGSVLRRIFKPQGIDSQVGEDYLLVPDPLYSFLYLHPLQPGVNSKDRYRPPQ